MLFARTTSKLSFNYSILNDIVKILKQWSKLAGINFLSLLNTKITESALWQLCYRNIIIFSETAIAVSEISLKSSETLRNETVTENVKSISIHVPTHLKPANDDQFGHYLAGLIDANGHFSSKQQLVLVFNSSDVSLAYYIKQRIGFGSVRKIKNAAFLPPLKKAALEQPITIILIIVTIKGLEKVINLINGKIRTESKFNQINNNILKHKNFVAALKGGLFGAVDDSLLPIALKGDHTGKIINFKLNPCQKREDFKNHWLAGFSDAASGSFQIKILNRNNKIEVRLNFQIENQRPFRAASSELDQKKNSILLLIKDFLGGNIDYRKSQNTYYYDSTSFGSAKNVINYFDNFHLLSNKHINYLKWRKTYIIIQNKDHLNKKGLEKIIKLKNTMNRLSETTTV